MLKLDEPYSSGAKNGINPKVYYVLQTIIVKLDVQPKQSFWQNILISEDRIVIMFASLI